MRKTDEAETDGRRAEREERRVRERKQQAAAEESALDAAVRKSIKQHGA